MPAAAHETARGAIAAATEALAAAGIDTPRLDAEVLLEEAAGIDRAHAVAEPDTPVTTAAAEAFAAMVERRAAREPVAYIVGRRGFRRLLLRCDDRALVPRPETEHLVDVALEAGRPWILDVGTGTGAVALAIADELAGAQVTATDTSRAALELASENARRLGLDSRVRFVEGTVPGSGGPWQLIVSNPPYVAEQEWSALAPEITRYEPATALVGGRDGLEAYREIVPACAEVQERGGLIALEVGAGQAAQVEEILSRVGYRPGPRRRDLAGIDRIVTGTRA